MKKLLFALIVLGTVTAYSQHYSDYIEVTNVSIQGNFDTHQFTLTEYKQTNTLDIYYHAKTTTNSTNFSLFPKNDHLLQNSLRSFGGQRETFPGYSNQNIQWRVPGRDDQRQGEDVLGRYMRSGSWGYGSIYAGDISWRDN